MLFFLSYRSRDEVKQMRQTYDPITSLKQKMIDAGFTTKEEFKVHFWKHFSLTYTPYFLTNILDYTFMQMLRIPPCMLR